MQTQRFAWVVVVVTACTSPPKDTANAIAPPGSDSPVMSEPERGPRAVGDPTQRAVARHGLAGVWAYEGEVWQFEDGRARVWRPRDTDILVERDIEMLAPCMFVAVEGDTRHGPYVVDYASESGRSTWTRGGVALYRNDSDTALTICHAPEVYRLEGNHCAVWRYDHESQTFDPVADDCFWGPSSPGWSVGLLGPEGEPLDEVEVPVHAMTPGPTGPAWAATLATACGFLGPDAPCTVAQARLLRETWWASDEALICSGAQLRLDLQPWFQNSVVLGPDECPIATGPGEPDYMVEQGLVLTAPPVVIRPGDWTSLQLVFENPTAQPKLVRLPSGFWRIGMTLAGEALDVGGCDMSGRRYAALPTTAAEFRVEPGGTLSIFTPWTAVTPIHRGQSCKVRPLRAKPHELTFDLVEGDPNASLRVPVEVRGQRVCDPCPEPRL